jgi:hypothetical protein
MEEGLGFEPRGELSHPGGFRDRSLKPLGQPSLSLRTGLDTGLILCFSAGLPRST